MFSGSLGCQDSRKIHISTKRHSIESHSRKDAEGNLEREKKKKECTLNLQITVGNLQKLANATTSVLWEKSAMSLQQSVSPHFMHTDPFLFSD